MFPVCGKSEYILAENFLQTINIWSLYMNQSNAIQSGLVHSLSISLEMIQFISNLVQTWSGGHPTEICNLEINFCRLGLIL